MQRREATQVIREISKSIPYVFITNISITDLTAKEVELRVVMHTDYEILEKIRSIVNGHQLAIREEGDALVIGAYGKRTNGFTLVS